MNRLAAAAVTLAILSLLLFVEVTRGDVRYSLDCTFDPASSSLRGTARILLTGPDVPDDDVLFINTLFSSGRRLELTGASVNGSPASISGGAAGAVLLVPESARGGELNLVIGFSLAAVPETEGIVLLDDNSRGGRRISWYPRVVETASPAAAYEVTFNLEGPGAAAHSAPVQRVQETGGGRIYRLEDTASTGLVIAVSPIFIEHRVAVGGCDLGLFAREGSERWSDNLTAILAEIYGHYSDRIPGFEYGRLDVVLAGESYARGETQPSIVILKDELDEMAERFGGVFAANYLRWRASLEFARTYWGGRIRHEEGAVPWLREGLALLDAEGYARSVLLGGPAFENIRQFYLNAARGELNTSLTQTAAEAERSGLDSLRVLAQSKGIWVTGMLRRQLGRSAWNGFVRELSRAEPGRILSTDKIQALAERVSGDSLDGFFDDWVRGDARFDYALGKVRYENSGAMVQILARGDAKLPARVRAIFEEGSERSQVVAVEGKETWVRFDGPGRLRRVEIDPELTLPDVNRGDNLRSFGTAERIELLFSIDKTFNIGEVIVSPPTAGLEGEREARFELTISNLTDQPRALGILFTTRFPGGRNRALTRLFLQFSPKETLTVRDMLSFPARGAGLAELRADYFLVPDREAFERISRRSVPALTNYYVVAAGDE